KPLLIEMETIAVQGSDPVAVEVRKTEWGPVVGRNHRNELMVMRWTAHDSEGVNLSAMALEQANSVEEALPLAAQSGIPGQNFLVVDRHGNQAWTILGPLPERAGDGFDGRQPQDWSAGLNRWVAYRAADDYPVVLNPEAGRLWTGNARMVSDELLDVVGTAKYALGARQQQIRDALLAQDRFNEADFLALQLDDRALFLDRWQGLLSGVLRDLTQTRPDTDLVEMAELVDSWSARAAADDVGYLLVKRFREKVIDQTVGHVHRYVRLQAGPVFQPGQVSNMLEYPVWALVTEQPERHLPPGFPDWDEFLQTMAQDTLRTVRADGEPLAVQTWGRFNRLSISHPLADSLGPLGRFVRMPKESMSGDTYMPRVQRPTTGASQRLIVAPGQEQRGIFHMATGQSAHPLSPFFDRGHRDWVEGTASPLLPGEPVYRLRFAPE
ncbi:MAG: penicillin acylase family protein, partial [Natronospirillum sp.]